MKEFALLFRQPSYDYSTFTPKDWEGLAKRWQDWVGNIVAQDKLVNNGIRLALEGKVLKAGGVITDGPFVEVREQLGSFIVVRAESLDDAITLAHGCPALDYEGSVEVRPVYAQ